MHDDASGVRSHGQLGNDLDLEPTRALAVEEASGELDGREEDSVVPGTEETKGDFDDKPPEGLGFIEAVGLEDLTAAAKALSGEDQGKLAILWIPDHVVDLGDVTERIYQQLGGRFCLLAGLQDAQDLGKDGVVLQLLWGVDKGDLPLGGPALHYRPGEQWDLMLDDEADEAVEQVQGVKRPVPLKERRCFSPALWGKGREWRNVELVQVGAGKDSKEAIKARLVDRAALEEL